MRKVLVLVCTYIVVCGYAQDCKVGGKRCADHEQCCGGCCFYGECVDTYRSCFSSLDVCDDHVCIDEEECTAYTPPQCPGCEPLAVCRSP